MERLTLGVGLRLWLHPASAADPLLCVERGRAIQRPPNRVYRFSIAPRTWPRGLRPPRGVGVCGLRNLTLGVGLRLTPPLAATDSTGCRKRRTTQFASEPARRRVPRTGWRRKTQFASPPPESVLTVPRTWHWQGDWGRAAFSRGQPEALARHRSCPFPCETPPAPPCVPSYRSEAGRLARGR